MPPALHSVRLLLIRHGQAGGNGVAYGPDAPLTEQGHRQADYIANALLTAGVSHVVSSPFRRALETAQATAARIDRQVSLDDRLTEFRMGGESTSTIGQIIGEKQYLRLWRPHHSLGEHGETLGRFQERVSAALSDLASAGEREPREREAPVSIAVFTHGGTIAAAMRWAYGLTPEHDWHSDVEIHNASITEVEHWPRGRHPAGAPHATALHRLNDVRHLPTNLVTDY